MTADPAADLAPLVERAQRGDETAFAALYQGRAGDVYRYVRSILRDPTVAEDVTSQTFLQAWQSLPRLRNAGRFDAWLFRIAHNAAISEARRPATTPLEATAEPPEPSRFADPQAVLDGKASAAQVREALLTLPETQREVIVLRFYAELSHEAVARQLDRSVANVRVLQFRALQRLRATLQAADAAV